MTNEMTYLHYKRYLGQNSHLAFILCFKWTFQISELLYIFFFFKGEKSFSKTYYGALHWGGKNPHVSQSGCFRTLQLKSAVYKVTGEMTEGSFLEHFAEQGTVRYVKVVTILVAPKKGLLKKEVDNGMF